MRALGLFKYGLGIAVAGGAVASMAGYAMAADSQSLPAQPGPVPAVTSTAVPTAAPAPPVDPGNATSTDGPTDQPQASDATNPNDQSQDSNLKTTSNPGTGTTGATPSDKNVKRAKATVGPHDGLPAKAAGDSNGSNPAPVVPAQPAVSTAPSSQVVVQPQVEAIPNIVVFHATALPIQPTITSRAASDLSDLAASLPSAPVTAKTPVPAKSNGALIKLQVLLAGVVVPQPYLPVSAAWWRGALLAVNLLLVLLLGSLFIFTYGQWLRRGGFVNAARSDMPIASSTSSLFATPHVLGYELMPPRHRSPNFVVADTNVRLNVSFAMPSERRICI